MTSFLSSKFYKQIPSFINKYQEWLLEQSLPSHPPYACIFMDHIKTGFSKTQHIKPWFWNGFVDDIFFTWTESEESLEKFLEDLNKFHSNLDVVIKIKEGSIVTDLYCKTTDGHQYLYYDSCHADHIKRSSY